MKKNSISTWVTTLSEEQVDRALKTSSCQLLLPDLGVSQGLGREEVQVSPGRSCRHRDMSPPPPCPRSQSSPIMGSRSRWRIRMEEAQVSKENKEGGTTSVPVWWSRHMYSTFRVLPSPSTLRRESINLNQRSRIR